MDKFLIFKNTKKVAGSNQPDYNIATTDADGKFVPWGAGWIKDGKNGKFISCQKSKPKAGAPLVDSALKDADDGFLNY